MKILITGASRGIGAAIAKTFAQKYSENAQIALLGRSLKEPSHPDTPGTLMDTVNMVNIYGSRPLPIGVDIQYPKDVVDSVNKVIDKMGGLDILINNASVLYLNPTIKQMNLLYNVNTQASLLTMKTAHEALTESNGSIVTVSPPINLAKLDWISSHPEYTISKYSMTLATLGNATNNIHANCIWPRYTIATSATKRLETMGYDGAFSNGRSTKDFAWAVTELAVSNKNAETLYDDEIIDLPKTQAPLDIFSNHCIKHLKLN